MKKLIIIGASGHGKVVADIAQKVGYTDILFLDDNPKLTMCEHYPVIGDCGRIAEFDDCDFVVAIGNVTIRRRLQDRLEHDKKRIAVLIHPSAVIGENVCIGQGSVVMAGAVINSGTVIGKGCIINTSCSVDHDCVLGDYVHVSVGAHIAGTVCVGAETWIGIGVIVSNNISVTEKCVIGAGAVVIRDITESGTYVGVPAVRKCEDSLCNNCGNNSGVL